MAGAVTAVLLMGILRHYARFRWRTIDDVPDAMRQPDYALLDELTLSPVAIEQALLTASRRQRRAELDKLEEQYARCYHNSRINKDWANTEFQDMLMFERRGEPYDPQTQPPIRELLAAATESCRDLLMVLTLIRFWTLVHALQLDRLEPFSLPATADLRTFDDRDILDSYRRLKLAIGGMGTIYTEENCQLIVAWM